MHERARLRASDKPTRIPVGLLPITDYRENAAFSPAMARSDMGMIALELIMASTVV
jgi:hypothetical protein